MGWDEQSANRSLVEANFDLEKAAMRLDDEEVAACAIMVSYLAVD